jgi:hypothetical protein
MASTKQDLMNLGKREPELVKLAGKEFLVKGLTDRERAEWELDCLDEEGRKDLTAMESIRPRLIAKCLVDDNGLRLFSDDEYEIVAEWPASVTVKLFEVCSRLCGLDEDDKEMVAKN